MFKKYAIVLAIICSLIWAQSLIQPKKTAKKIINSVNMIKKTDLGLINIKKIVAPNDSKGVPENVDIQGYLTDNNGQPVNGNTPMVFSLWTAQSGGTQVWTSGTITVSVENGLFNQILGIPYTAFELNQQRWMEVTVNSQTLSPRIEITSSPWSYTATKSDTSVYAFNSDKLDGYDYDNLPYGNGDITSVNGGNGLAPDNGPSGDITLYVNTGSGITISNDAVTFDQNYGDNRYVNEGQSNSISSGMIQDGTITGTDIASLSVPLGDLSQSGASNGQVVKWNGSQWAPANDNTGSDNDWFISGTDMYSGVSGKVGIGTASPSYKLHVANGETYFAGNVGIGVNPSVPLEVSRNSGLAVRVTTNSGSASALRGVNNGTYAGVEGISAGSGPGVYGEAQGEGVLGKATSTSGDRWGGQFVASGGGSALVGVSMGGTNYKILGSGNQSCVTETRYGKKILFGPECPEPYFEDFGHAQLINGHCHIELDPIFLDCVKTDADHPMKVFIQLNDDCNGVYVKVGQTGFDVYELHNGTNNASFTYRVVANRKDTDYLRFPKFSLPERSQK